TVERRRRPGAPGRNLGARDEARGPQPRPGGVGYEVDAPLVAARRAAVGGIAVRGPVAAVDPTGLARSAERDVEAVVGERVGGGGLRGERSVERQRDRVPTLQLAGRVLAGQEG